MALAKFGTMPDGSPGLLEFSARWVELGVQKTF